MKPKIRQKPKWIVYILLCGDGTYYTGITNNLEKRCQAHECGKGAKYTRGRLPLKIIYTEMLTSKSKALKRELQIKTLNRTDKEKLIANQN